MYRYRLKNFIYTAAALLLCLAVSIGVRAANVSRLSALEGERTFFLDSASSQGLRKSSLSFRDLLRVKGESVRFSLEEGGRYALNENSPEEIARKIAEGFDAEILFYEEAAGTISYYCYTPRWNDGISIAGERVNLHVAINGNACAVGTPIIFDGF